MAGSRSDNRKGITLNLRKIYIPHKILLAIIVIFFIIVLILQFRQDDNLYSSVLISLGVACYVVAMLLMEHKSNSTIIIPIMLTFLMAVVMGIWILFIYSKFIPYLIWICLAFTVFSTLFSLLIVTIKISPNSDQDQVKDGQYDQGKIDLDNRNSFSIIANDIRDQINENRSCYLFIALTLFLTTLYFTAFAFAFHDTDERKYALDDPDQIPRYGIFRNHIDSPQIFQSNQKTVFNIKNKLKDTKAGNSNTKDTTVYANNNYNKSVSPYQHIAPRSTGSIATLLHAESNETIIRFTPSHAEISLNLSSFNKLLKQFLGLAPTPNDRIDKNYKDKYFISQGIEGEIIDDIFLRNGIFKVKNDLDNTADGPLKDNIEAEYINAYYLAIVISDIFKNADSYNVITVSGYASQEMLTDKDMYRSNYELSEARASRVREKIYDLLVESNKIFNSYSSSFKNNKVDETIEKYSNNKTGNDNSPQNGIISEYYIPSIEWIIIPKTHDNKDCDRVNNKNKGCYKAKISIKRKTNKLLKNLADICDNHQQLNKGQKMITCDIDEIKKNTKELQEFGKLKSDINDLIKTVNAIKEKTDHIVNSHNILDERTERINLNTSDSYSNAYRLSILLENSDSAMQNLTDLASKITTIEEINNPKNPKAPRLLDYFHYTIYTITTTGYGDMIPFSNFAKFLTALSNIIEIIFGLIFFNVILARDPRRKNQDQTGTIPQKPNDISSGKKQ